MRSGENYVLLCEINFCIARSKERQQGAPPAKALPVKLFPFPYAGPEKERTMSSIEISHPHENVAVLAIRRPERRNALNLAVRAALADAVIAFIERRLFQLRFGTDDQREGQREGRREGRREGQREGMQAFLERRSPQFAGR